MAGETLLSIAQLIANTPDNTTGQIDALDLRNILVSLANGVGGLEAQDNFSVPIDAGVWVSLNDIAVNGAGNADVVSNNGWKQDANGAWIPDYTGVNLTPGVLRLVTIATSGDLDKQGGGSDTYEFQYFVGGIGVGRLGSTEYDGDAQTYGSKTETFVYEPALGLSIDLRVRGVGTNDDLLFTSFRQEIVSAQL